jgi:4-hydroxy-4-methyl-2-oxoglutarate aldolase
MREDLRQKLMAVSVASIADSNKQLSIMDSALRPVLSGLKLVGPARTVKCHEDFLTIIQALDNSDAGEVIVVDSCNSTRALIGELFTSEALRRGLAGLVIDGPVRDIASIRKLEIPVYARSFCPCSGTTIRLMDEQIPIVCGGVAVNPGDIVFGDDDGILIASEADLLNLVDNAFAIEEAELELLKQINSGKPLVEMLNFKEHVKSLKAGTESSLKFKL